MARRVGIYPGTFDPVHSGHIAFASKALQTCNLDEVIFLPEQSPRGKDHVTDILLRVAQLTEATAATAGLRVAEPSSARFTVQDTLPELRRMFPNAELTLLVGSDVARTLLYRWEGLNILLAEVALAVGLRHHDTSSEMAAIFSILEQQYDTVLPYTLIRTPHAHIASTQFRNGKLTHKAVS